MRQLPEIGSIPYFTAFVIGGRWNRGDAVGVMRMDWIKAVAPALLFAAAAMPVSAEHVFLKDGSIIEGKVVGDDAGAVTVRDGEKKLRRVPRSDIMLVLYTDLHMGKVFVQKRDGRNMTAYLVDEDRFNYTFRNELNSPVEFVLRRADVLFIAERNPSGLKGEAGTDRVGLEWFPSYEEMRRYNIYAKKKDGGYSLAGTSGRNSHILRGLSSNTEYHFMVKGVDAQGVETAPSNELKISTKNMFPDGPRNIVKKLEPSGATRITWRAATDPDGTIVRYRLYANIDGKRAVVGDTAGTEYRVQDAPRYGGVEVVAVDDRGDESEPEYIRLVDLGIAAYATAGVIYPLGKFGEMAEPGIGGSFALMYRDIGIDGLDAGLECGIFYLPGRDIFEEEQVVYHRSVAVPVLARAEYRAGIAEKIALVPALSLGYSWNDTTYMRSDPLSLAREERRDGGFDPMIQAGVSLEYGIGGSVFLRVVAAYGTFIEQSGRMDYVVAGAGINYTL